jgi:hypothetical protein
LSHLQAAETQGYLQLNVTRILIARYEIPSALQQLLWIKLIKGILTRIKIV